MDASVHDDVNGYCVDWGYVLMEKFVIKSLPKILIDKSNKVASVSYCC